MSSFTGPEVSSAKLKGNLILLDFWEVWCGPCIESMPKIQKLYESYKDKGLQVFGVMNDLKQLDPAKTLCRKKRL